MEKKDNDGDNPFQPFRNKPLREAVPDAHQRTLLVETLRHLDHVETAMQWGMFAHVMCTLTGTNPQTVQTHATGRTDAQVAVAGRVDAPLVVLGGDRIVCAIVRNVTIRSTLLRVARDPEFLTLIVLADPDGGGGGQDAGGGLLRLEDAASNTVSMRRESATVAVLLKGGLRGDARLLFGLHRPSSRLLVRSGGYAFATMFGGGALTLVREVRPQDAVPWQLRTNEDRTCRAIMAGQPVTELRSEARVVTKRFFGDPVSPEVLAHFPRAMGIERPTVGFFEAQAGEAARAHLRFGASSIDPAIMTGTWQFFMPVVFFPCPPDWIVAVDPHHLFRIRRRAEVEERGEFGVLVDTLPEGWCIQPLLLRAEEITMLEDLSRIMDNTEEILRHTRTLLGAKGGPFDGIALHPC